MLFVLAVVETSWYTGGNFGENQKKKGEPMRNEKFGRSKKNPNRVFRSYWNPVPSVHEVYMWLISRKLVEKFSGVLYQGYVKPLSTVDIYVIPKF